jgi:hypothetical protein
MGKLIYTILFVALLSQSPLSAQADVRLGFKAGYSMSTQYGITTPNIPYTVDSHYRNGFVGGVMFNFPITETFAVQQEFLYVTKGSSQDITMHDFPVTTYTEYNLNYFEIPFIVRYTFVRFGSFSIYGSSGFALSVLLNGDSYLKGVVDLGFSQTTFTDSTEMEGVDIFDYGFLYGAGIDFKLFNKDCFFEYRFNIGWNTLMMPTSEGQDPAPLRNQDYIFTLGFYI